MHRDVSRKSASTFTEQPVQKGRGIIVVIGIDEYEHFRKLHNAVKDAQGIQKLFVEKLGFLAPVDPLLDEDATKDAITELVQDRLPEVLEPDDSLLLFFAGHGHTRVRKVGKTQIETGYIIPAEAHRDRWSDYIKMNSFLEDVSQLPARHVLVILDACHSGFALGSAMEIHRSGEVRYEQDVVRRRSRKVVTSARRDQRALDGGPIPGHSLFTGTLIDGLQSKKADLDGNNFVTSSELGLYVQQQVAQASVSEQTPDFGSFLLDDRGELVISFKLEDVKRHYELGCHLYELGWILDDRGRFESAIRHFDEAIKLSPEPLPQAHLESGRARLALGQYEEAIQDFQKAAEQAKDLSEASLYLGIAYAKKGENENAVSALDTYLERQPEDDRAPWIRELASQLSPQPDGARYALLIGIGEYVAHPQVRNLEGPANDVRLMRDVLVQRYAFDPDNITALQNAKATREGILAGLDTLRQQTGPSDTVLIYYSGHSFQGDAPSYLVPHDTIMDEPGYQNTIDPEELNKRIARIPAARKTLVFDTHATDKFVELAREQTDYTLFLATSPDQPAYEHQLQVDEGRTMPVGLFTYAFVGQLGQLPPHATQGEILRGVVEEVQRVRETQTPLLFGSADQPLFARKSYDDYLTFFDFSQRQNYAAPALDEIHRQYAVLEKVSVPFPQLHYSFGRAFMEKGDYPGALQALQIAVEEGGQRHPEAVLALGIAQLRTQRYDDALETFQRYLETVPSRSDQMQEPLALVEQLQHDRKHALLIGIDEYEDDTIPNVRGAVNDVRALKRILTNKFGFHEADIGVLINGDAGREAIIEAFQELVEKAREEPALFYFAGNGSLGTHTTPTIVSADGRQSGTKDIELRELAQIVGDAPTNLTTIIDAGWKRGDELPWGVSWGSRFAPPPFVSRDIIRVRPEGVRERPVGWGPDRAPRLLQAAGPDEPWLDTGVRPEWQEWQRQRDGVRSALGPFKIGRLSIYHVSIQTAVGAEYSQGGEAVVEDEFPALNGSAEKMIHGALTYALITTMQGSDPNDQTYAQLARAASARLKWLQPFVLADNPDEKVFSNSIGEEKVHALVSQRIFQEPVRKTTTLLRRTIEKQHGADPDSHLDLGVAYAAIGDYRKSIDALETAIDQRDELEYSEARYHLGRVLLESQGDLDRAVSELRRATAHDSAIVPAYYYLGQAIRRRVERETEDLVKAEEALRTYLAKGAPLGKREEVQQFLSSRKLEEQKGSRLE